MGISKSTKELFILEKVDLRKYKQVELLYKKRQREAKRLWRLNFFLFACIVINLLTLFR